MLTIRLLKYSDLYKIQKINIENLPENYTMAYYLFHRMKYPNINYVAIIDNQIIGYVLCKLEEKDNKFEGNITSICIDSKYRKKGIGIKLMEIVLNEMKGIIKQEELRVYLNVRITNKPAIEFYKKRFGFKILKLEEKYYFNKEDAYKMEKVI